MKQDVYLSNGILLANSFNRVVHGERGDYVEFEIEHFKLQLSPYFVNNKTCSQLLEEGHYYQWLYPKEYKEYKVYYQLRTVKYADYKVGKYYVSPSLLLNFKDPEKLF